MTCNPCNHLCETLEGPQAAGLESPWSNKKPQVSMDPDEPPCHCTRTHVPRRPDDFYYKPRNIVANHLTVDPHHVLVVQTAPRTPPTLNGTITSLKKAGLERWPGPKILIADGMNIFCDHPSATLDFSQTVASSTVRGPAATFVMALKYAIEIDHELTALTYIEDDVSLCRFALDYIQMVPVPSDLALLTWFSYPYDYSTPRHTNIPSGCIDPDQTKGLTKGIIGIRPSRFYILNQCCTFPRSAVDRLLKCPHVNWGWHQKYGSDEMIPWALGDAPYGTHFPILAQHTGGNNSAILLDMGKEAQADTQHQGDRTSPWYTGDDFNALSLLGSAT
jgi:hypothetical protein